MKSLNVDYLQRLQVLGENVYFEGLESAALETLAARTTFREFERGEVLFWEGDPCQALCILEEGSVKLYRVSAQDRQYIIRVLQEGDTFNEVPAFDGGQNVVTVEALETTRVWMVEPEVVREMIHAYPRFAEKIIENLSRNLRNLVRTISEMAFLQITHRLARLIHEIDGQAGGQHWTQEQLAARLGTVREVVARSLKELERSGAIRMEGRRIQISNPEVLTQWTQPWN